MSKWTLYSNTYNIIANTLKGGTACLTAYKDYTCELPIKLFIDAYEEAIFFSVTIQNQRNTYAIANPESYTKHKIIQAIIGFISAAANDVIGIKTGSEEVKVELFDPTATVKNIKKNLALL